MNTKQVNESVRKLPDPGLGAALIGAEEEALVLEVLRRKDLFRYYGRDAENPPAMVATLEREFAQMTGSRFALAVTSGTAALEAALGALGVGPGDEVIAPAWSWVSCFTSVVRLGGRPVLAEIDETFCLAAGEISRLRTARTKAVMVIHYQGVSADLEPILAEAKKAGIAVLEDCAESPGVLYRGRRIGTWGEIGIFSFQHNKTITSGEGGMVVTDDSQLYERVVRMHDLGLYRPLHEKAAPANEPAFCGSQFRMSELTAAVALAQVRRLEGIRAHCRKLSRRILGRIGGLAGLDFRRVPDPEGDTGFEIYFMLRDSETAAEFKRELSAMNVPSQQMTGTYCHYRRAYCLTGRAHAPGASPFAGMEPWPAKGYRPEDFPRTEALIHRFVTLPLGMLYTEEDADYIASAVERAHKRLALGSGNEA